MKTHTTSLLTRPPLDLLQSSRSFAQIPGKMGEFAQGVIGGQPFLVTAVFSTSPFQATAQAIRATQLEPEGVHQRAHSGVATKTERLLAKVYTDWGVDEALNIQIWNPAGVGKGMGSSSVDMAGAVYAAARLLGRDVDDMQLYRAMCEVERSDFLTRPESLMVTNPETGEAFSAGAMPNLFLVCWDDNPTGMVDTAAVAGLDKQRVKYSGAYQDILAGVTSGDTADFAAATTLSAVINDRWIPKASLPLAQQWARQTHSGVVVAHTGTFIGVACADYQAACWVMRQANKMKANPFMGQCGVVAKVNFN